MVSFSHFQRKTLINYVLLFLSFSLIGNIKAETNESSRVLQPDKETPIAPPEQKSVKKELKVKLTDLEIEPITPPAQEKDDHTGKLVIIDDKSVIESSGKALEQQIIKGSAKTDVSEPATTKPIISIIPQHHQHNADEDFVLNDEDDISESLKTGFYFFLILSSSAVVFIIFKIYRLRLSRAERKYGVQGDRSTQELTPLPVSIEDGHSDDEDQTVFEIQRQNIRIL